MFRLRSPQPKEDAAPSGSLALCGMAAGSRYCSIPAWPGWDPSSLAQITAWCHWRGPCSCSTWTVISSLLSLFPPRREEVHLCSLSPLPHQEAHHCWTVFTIHWARREGEANDASMDFAWVHFIRRIPVLQRGRIQY